MEILSSPHITFTLVMGSSSSYNPLFSSIVTLYILIFLYFPNYFVNHIIISPILISTLFVLLTLLRLGASQQSRQQQQQQRSKNGVETKDELRELFPKLEVHSFTELKAETQFEHEVSNKIDQSQEEAKVEQHYIRDTRASYEPNPRPSTEPVKECANETDSSQEGGEVDPHCNRAKTRPFNELSPEQEPELLLNADNANEEHEQKQPGPFDGPNPYCAESFVEWGVWAPLEVIYEAYEGEEGEEEDQNDAFVYNHSDKAGTDSRYPSLSRYYPESDTDTDTDTDSEISSSSFDEDYLGIQRWDEEEKEGMFEIALDYGCGDDKSVIVMKKLRKVVEDVDEEDNLIEIDISPSKSDIEFCW